MPRGRFITLIAVVSAFTTAALLLGAAAARSGDTALGVVAALSGVVALAGIVVVGRVVVVVERARSRR